MTNKKKVATAAAAPKAAQPMPINIAFAELLEKTNNPWTEVPKFKTTVNNYNDYIKTLDHCRFFYRTDTLVSTVIDKLVQIGITDISIAKGKLTDNEYRVFTSIKSKLVEFAEQMATEYLISGLVVPEIGYNKVSKDFIFSLGIKKYNSLVLPDSMWVRDSRSVKIKTSLLGDKPTYFVKVPEGLAAFLKSGGKYPDGTEDKELYDLLKKFYPDFVRDVLAGKTEMKLENDLVFRRKYTSDNPYPISYVAASLESLHHKRKLRRMDYSIIDKIISAIMHVKVGSDEFPITESDEDQEFIDGLRNELRMRGRNEDVLERIFQLITNHTVDISWVFPDTATLLNAEKYNDINQEILFGLGFPRLLISGEAFRSGTSDPEIATLSPIKTAEEFRRKILEVFKSICTEISKRNGFNSVPEIQFKAINLTKFADFLQYLSKLYETSAISRTTLGNEFGYNFKAEVDLLGEEKELLKEKGLSEFGATPNSKNSVLMNGEDPEGGDSDPASGKPAPKKAKPAKKSGTTE